MRILLEKLQNIDLIKNKLKKIKSVKTNVEEMFEKFLQGKLLLLPVIIKADVQGSAEAIESSIIKLSTEEVKNFNSDS